MPGGPRGPPQPQGHQLELWWLNGVPVTVPGLHRELVESSGAARALGPASCGRGWKGGLEHTHRVPGDVGRKASKNLTSMAGAMPSTPP